MRDLICPRSHCGCNFPIESKGAGLICRSEVNRACNLYATARTLWRLRPLRLDRTCLQACVSQNGIRSRSIHFFWYGVLVVFGSFFRPSSQSPRPQFANLVYQGIMHVGLVCHAECFVVRGWCLCEGVGHEGAGDTGHYQSAASCWLQFLN